MTPTKPQRPWAHFWGWPTFSSICSCRFLQGGHAKERNERAVQCVVRKVWYALFYEGTIFFI